MLLDKPGVYMLIAPSGSAYVGSSIRLRRRVLHHFARMRCGEHENASVQAAFTKYGSLEAKVLEYCDKDVLLAREQHWIDTLHPNLNGCKFAGAPMRDAGVAAKLSAALRGRSVSEEWRRRISATKSGVTLSDEQKRRISEATKGIPKSQAMRAKLAATKCRPVESIDAFTGQVVRRYGSAKAAALELALARSSISQVCNGQRRICGGFVWRFA